jgi:hypothetical protein
MNWVCEQLATTWKLRNKNENIVFQNKKVEGKSMDFHGIQLKWCFEEEILVHNTRHLCLEMKILKGFHPNGIN